MDNRGYEKGGGETSNGVVCRGKDPKGTPSIIHAERVGATEMLEIVVSSKSA